jgi:hypothetical protein
MTQIRQFMSELLTACGREIYPGDDEVVLMQSFALLGAQRDMKLMSG